MKSVSLKDKSFYESYSEQNVTKTDKNQIVFKDTNLSVFYIGTALTNQSKVDILEDYPYLTLDDLRYARIHYNVQINKKPEELAPDYDPTKKAIENMRKAEVK